MKVLHCRPLGKAVPCGPGQVQAIFLQCVDCHPTVWGQEWDKMSGAR